MKSFEIKARDYYGEVVINKGLMARAGFGSRALPVYVGEWIISQFLGKEGGIDESSREQITGIPARHAESGLTFDEAAVDRGTCRSRSRGGSRKTAGARRPTRP